MLTPDLIQANLEFLKRTPLNGAEAPAMILVVQALERELQSRSAAANTPQAEPAKLKAVD